MTDLWSTLLPLIIGSAVVPVHLVITILLLRSSRRATAIAWVGGMTALRVVQGVVFGLLLGAADDAAPDPSETATIASVLLLVIAVVLYVTAIRYLLDQPEEDAPPPKWMAMLDDVSAGRAFLLGFGLLAIGPKFWVFTLGAIGAIEYADLGQPSATLTYLVFALLAASTHIALVGSAIIAPARADVMLGAVSRWLTANNRAIMVVVGAAFGTWFLVKALDGLGIL